MKYIFSGKKTNLPFLNIFFIFNFQVNEDESKSKPFHYEKITLFINFSFVLSTALLDKLKSAIKEQYGIGKLALEDCVIFIHGIPEGNALRDSVPSLPGVLVHITLPIACGVIKAL